MAYQFCITRSPSQTILFVFALVLLGYLPSNFLRAQSEHSVTQLKIDDGRPVAKAIEEIVARSGYVITYEDPRYIYEEDLLDVTTQVRRDLDRYPVGKAPKVSVPRGGKLSVNVSSVADAQGVASVLDDMIQAQSARESGGRFSVVRVGDVFHVVPIAVRDQNGNWIAQNSILDVPISLPMEDRSESEMLDAIVKEVGLKAHVKIYMGGESGVGEGISNPSRPASYKLGADNERASDVIMRALVLLNDHKAGTWITQRLRWQLFYDVDDNANILNISVVPDLPVASLPVGVQKTYQNSSVSGASSGTSTGTIVKPPSKPLPPQ